MRFNIKPKTIVFLAVILSLLTSGLVTAQVEVIELKFGLPPAADSDTARTLQSLVKVQGTGGHCQSGLYLLTHYGDREELWQKENQNAIDNPLLNHTWRYCSAFSTAAENAVFLGRNWDNENVGSIIVSLYRPPEGYAAISFSRAIDLGFPLNMDLEQIKAGELGNRLLLAPFYAMDGINEHGVAVAVAGIRQTTHQPQSDKKLVFITFLIRKILDQTKNIEEAVNLVDKFIPFDLNKNSCNGHFIVADASGRSVILEYDQDQWRKIYQDKSWQVLTTKPIYGVPDADLRRKCRRFRSISENLEQTAGRMDWERGMKILQDAQQISTTWSAVYALLTGELHFAVYQQWETVYHLRIP